MEYKKKGICTNFGNCKNADSKQPVELNVTEDFVCPECDGDLTELAKKNIVKNLKKKYVIAFIVIILAFIGIYITILQFTKNVTEQFVEEGVNIIQDSISDDESTPVVIDKIAPDPVTKLTAEGFNRDGSSYATLDWISSNSTDINYYKVTGSKLKQLKDSLGFALWGTNTFTDVSVVPGEKYEYTVYSVDSSGNVSLNNPTVSIKVPTGVKPLPPPDPNYWKTINFDYGKYNGQVNKNDLMHGVGEFHFTVRHLISEKDWKKRYAEAGDILKGTWNEGSFSTGKLYDANGKFKETIIIGQK